MTADYTAERLAQVTGTSVDRLETLERFGLLHRNDDGRYAADSVERVILVRHAEERGITDEEIERFCRDSDVLDSLLAGRRIDAPALTVDELLGRLPVRGVDEEFIERLMNLLGPGPGEPVTEDDAAALQMAIAALELGFPTDALLQLIRVMAESVQRVAEAENRVFHDYVHERNRASGLTGRELMEATDRLSQPLLAMAEPALVYLHQRAFAREMREDFVRHLTEHSRPPVERPGEAPATLVFIDLAGFTPMTLTMGDSVAADVLRRFATIVRAAASRRRGRIVKQIGDAFMLVFEVPVDAILFGVDVCADVARESRFPAVHVGAHHGTVLYRDGDYVGTTVNLAARVAGASEPGQFLVTAELAAAAEAVTDVTLKPMPPADLKGIDAPQQLFEVRADHAAPQDEVDPVCGMRLLAGDEHASTTVDGLRYVFCSEDCRAKFVESPDSYLSAPLVKP